MNFGLLLVAGKSVMNGREVVAYRESKHVYVPRFEPPPRGGARAAAVQTAPAVAAPALRPPAVRAPAVTAPVSAKAIPARLATSFKPRNAVATTPPPAEPAHWAARLNPVSLFRGSSAAPARAAQAAHAAQPELSLDAVRVVHNDLSDTEEEVMTFKKLRTDRSGTTGSGGLWGSLGARFFGNGGAEG